MKLLSKKLERRFAQVGSQENAKDPLIITEFLNPAGFVTFYATEYNPATRTFFGYVSLSEDNNGEWGYFTLDELEFLKKNLLFGIVCDHFFQEQPASHLISK